MAEDDEKMEVALEWDEWPRVYTLRPNPARGVRRDAIHEITGEEWCNYMRIFNEFEMLQRQLSDLDRRP